MAASESAATRCPQLPHKAVCRCLPVRSVPDGHIHFAAKPLFCPSCRLVRLVAVRRPYKQHIHVVRCRTVLTRIPCCPRSVDENALYVSKRPKLIADDERRAERHQNYKDGLIETEPTSELVVISCGEVADLRTVIVDVPTNVWLLIL